MSSVENNRRERDNEHHFNTSHLKENLVQRSARGGLVTVGSQVIKFSLQMGSTMVLARLLTPADFGLLAMVAFFTGLIGLFKDLGLSAATVQRREVGHSQVSTLFWINVALSIVLMLLTMAVSPAIAWFYGEEELVWITIAISVTFVLGGLSAQHIALLRRQMRFSSLAIIEIGSMAFGIACGITFAVLGAGYWALVALTAGQALGLAALAFLFSGWIPGRWRFDEEVKQMFGFGANLTGFNLLNYFTRNADNLLIGRVWGASELGVYSKAYALLLMPMQQINLPIGAVAIPAMSRLQDDPEEFRNYYQKTLTIIAYASMPLVVLLGVLANEIVFILLGPQWGEAAQIFQIFAVFVVVQNVLSTTGWVMQSLGRSRRMLNWGLIQAPVLVIAVLIGLPWGPKGVAIAVTGQAFLMAIPAMLYAYHDSPVSIWHVFHAVSRPLTVSAGLFLLAGGAYVLTASEAFPLRIAAVGGCAIVLFTALLLYCRPVREDLIALRTVLRRGKR